MYQNIATKVLTGEVRCSYVHLTEPYANPTQIGAKPKYMVTILIPKTDTVTYNDIKGSIDAAYEDAVQKRWKGLRPQLASPLIHDGDAPRRDGSAYGDECRGHWVLTASSTRKPQVVHQSNIMQELAPQDIYSGMYARVTLNFYSFDTAGNKGIGCGLGNVMKTRDGEPLSGGASASTDFEGLQLAAPAAQQADLAGAMATPNIPTYIPETAQWYPQYQGQPMATAQYAMPQVQGWLGNN